MVRPSIVEGGGGVGDEADCVDDQTAIVDGSISRNRAEERGSWPVV
jgi:hypothetical protein